MKEQLIELCRLCGISGNEDEVREYIISRVEADSVTTDALGNLIVFKQGKKRPRRKLLYMAHMDEVGLMCKSATDGGFIKFGAVGGIDARVLPGKRVYIGKARIPGVIGIKPIHLCEEGETDKAVKLKNLYIDIGAPDKAAALNAAAPGTPVYFGGQTRELANGCLRAKALDDRIGCCVLLQMLQRPHDFDCHYAFTAQEENGARGAKAAVYSIAPDIAVVVEGTTAADLPEAAHRAVCALGKGAVVPFMDKGAFYSRELFTALREIAEKEHIPWQTKEYVSGGTDAASAQRSLAGALVVCVAAPVRYIHSPSSVVSLQDTESVLQLAWRSLNHFGGA
ncbi:MAG: M42 family peptidase [Oscillospiraceae bacterium]|jgi:endoglucanase|nr:M42 family peptidase [Oscillospiraceae bacterium]